MRYDSFLRYVAVFFLLLDCKITFAQSITGPDSVIVNNSISLSLVPFSPLGLITHTEVEEKSPSASDFYVLAKLTADATEIDTTPTEVGEYRYRTRYTGVIGTTEIMTPWSSELVVDVKADEEIISINTLGEPANGQNYSPGISADGRYVGYFSTSTNVVPGRSDILHMIVRDRSTQTSIILDENSDGTFTGAYNSQPTFSPDGQSAAYSAGGGVYIRNLSTKARTVIPSANTLFPQYSGDGRYIVYLSVPGAIRVVSLYDIASASTTTVSKGYSGEALNSGVFSQPSISDDGRYIVYSTKASNVVPGDTDNYEDVFLLDRSTNITTLISLSTLGDSYDPRISGDGATIVFTSKASDIISGDTNGVSDVFSYDVSTTQVKRISLSEDNSELSVASTETTIDATGTHIIYASASNHYSYNTINQERNFIIKGVSVIVGSSKPVISRDGKFVAIQSSRSNGELIMLAPVE